MIQVLKSELTALAMQNKHDWDINISLALMAYRSATQPSTTFSPHFLMFGREMRLPIELTMGLPPHPLVSQNEYVRQLQKTMVDTFAIVREKMLVVQNRQKEYYDHTAHGEPYHVGQTVYPMNKPYQSLIPHWSGPWIIQEITGKKTYKIVRATGKN